MKSDRIQLPQLFDWRYVYAQTELQIRRRLPVGVLSNSFALHLGVVKPVISLDLHQGI